MGTVDSESCEVQLKKKTIVKRFCEHPIVLSILKQYLALKSKWLI